MICKTAETLYYGLSLDSQDLGKAAKGFEDLTYRGGDGWGGSKQGFFVATPIS